MESLYLDYTTGEAFCQDEIELIDGRRRWKDRKKMSLKTGKLMEHYDYERGKRIEECGTYLKFKQIPDGSLKLKHANFCRERMCPMCQWRRSLKLGTQADKIYRVLTGEGYSHIFVTLTVKNCKAEELNQTVDSVLNGFYLLRRKSLWMNAIRGYYRALEITYNSESDTYHPHIHVLCTVDSNYFVSDEYIKHDQLMEAWKDVMKLDYNPSVHIERVKQKPNQRITSACAEVCKYPVKTAEVNDWHTLEVMDYALRGRRLIQWGGITLKTRKELELDDVEKGNLIVTDEEAMSEEEMREIIYVWRYGVYVPFDMKRVDMNTRGEALFV